MKTIFAILAVVGLSLFWYAGVRDQEAMAKCAAKGFSYDTCFVNTYN